MTVVVMKNITTIGLTLYISVLPVTDRIKALKVAAQPGSFSFSLLLVCLQEALYSVFNHVLMHCVSCQGSVSCIYDRTHAFTELLQTLIRRYFCVICPLPLTHTAFLTWRRRIKFLWRYYSMSECVNPEESDQRFTSIPHVWLVAKIRCCYWKVNC